MFRDNGQTRTAEMLATAFGDEIGTALKNPDVIEIMVNPDGRLWIEAHGGASIDSGVTLSPNQIERVIRLVASHIGREANSETPIVSAELPISGERFEGVLPPVTASPCFSIRKPAGRVITLDEYVSVGAMSPHVANALRQAVTDRANILIVGGTGSGKTTLANAVLAEIAHTGDRVILLEDTRELQCAAQDVVAMRTQPGSVTLSDLVRSTLRLRPDRIVVGEVRGPEALDMLKAWNTGHPGGIATLHANSAEAGLYRLEQLLGEATHIIPNTLIAETIDRVVFVRRIEGLRRIETMFRVTGSTVDGYELEPITPDFKLVPIAERKNP